MAVPEPGRAASSLDADASSIAELIEARAEAVPHHVYVEGATGSRRVTYGDVQAASRRWAGLLGDLGTGAGDRVGIAVSDPLDFTLVFLGVLAAGRAVAPIDPAATPAEIVAVCGRTAPRLVVSDRAVPGELELGEGRWAPEWVTMPAGTFALGGPASDQAPPVLDAPAAAGAGAGGVVLSTSGTTGVPKVIHLEQGALLHAARAIAAHHELSGRDRGFNPLPLFHINAEVVGLLATMVAGAALVVDDRFHRHGFWDLVGRLGVTWINAVPAILARLADLHADESVPAGIRFARSASAPLPLPVLERFERTTGIPVVETYGMTEAASQITANPLDGGRKPGSVGRPVGVEVRVGSDGGVPAIVGPVGIRGPSVIRSYASSGYEERFDAEGWLDTGDLGYLDEEGYLYLVGRADDVINRSGEKIYPRELEDVILAVPGVAAAAVVGSDHEVLGRVPVAYLVVEDVRDATGRTTAEAVVARVHERCTSALSRPKRPAAFYVVESLPQGTNGKIQRRAVTGGVAIYSLLVQ